MSRSKNLRSLGIRKHRVSAVDSFRATLSIMDAAPKRIQVLGWSKSGAHFSTISMRRCFLKIPRSHNEAKQLTAPATTNSTSSNNYRVISNVSILKKRKKRENFDQKKTNHEFGTECT
jgi:hypothetical protein